MKIGRFWAAVIVFCICMVIFWPIMRFGEVQSMVFASIGTAIFDWLYLQKKDN